MVPASCEIREQNFQQPCISWLDFFARCKEWAQLVLFWFLEHGKFPASRWFPPWLTPVQLPVLLLLQWSCHMGTVLAGGLRRSWTGVGVRDRGRWAHLLVIQASFSQETGQSMSKRARDCVLLPGFPFRCSCLGWQGSLLNSLCRSWGFFAFLSWMLRSEGSQLFSTLMILRAFQRWFNLPLCSNNIQKSPYL